MAVRGMVKSHRFWIGAAAGMIAGPWALRMVRKVSGVGLSLPSVGGGGNGG